jgi:hypothetical protein
MEKSIKSRIHKIDKEIIKLYDLVGANGEKSLSDIENQIEQLKNKTNFNNSKIYKFQCCDCDWELN